MRKIRYQVACSLDGYIAGPNDDFDWIVADPSYDFDALFAQFDTLLMGRRTYEIVRDMPDAIRGKKVIVASRTRDPRDFPGVEVVSDDLENRVRALREEPGLDIWLYGGGDLFAQMLEWNLVDTVELAVIPVLLGEGIRFLPRSSARHTLKLDRHQAYPSGMLLLEYSVIRP